MNASTHSDHAGESGTPLVTQRSGGMTAPHTTQEGFASTPTIETLLQGRRAATPGEFAKMFGHHPTWGYRQVYAGRVKVIRGAGRVLIPMHEIERFERDTVTYGELKTTRLTMVARKNG